MFQKSILSLMVLFLILFSGCAALNNDKLVYKSDKDVLMFILDGSGSMMERDASGKIKIAAAKDMLKDISSQLDANKINVGLISFNKGCSSTKLLIEPSNNDFDRVVTVSSTISPLGKTPLAASIRKAGDVLQNIDKKVNIIIISDGVETCGGDPVAEAKRLKSKYGIDAHIYVIGYSVDRNTQRELEKLAQAGGGSYYSADDSVALDKIITTITDELDIKADNWNGNTFKFKINFDSGSAKLKKEYYPQVKQFARYLKKTGYAAELQGHTDSSGSKKSNKNLSQKRAQSVVNKLIEYGVDRDKVYAVGYGSLAPIAANQTKEGRFENRRVEAHIIKNGKMDISYINQANANNALNVKYADKNSFVGYYKVLNPYKSYDDFHVWMELYANEKGYFSEYENNKKLTQRGEEPLSWDYSRTKHILSISSLNPDKNSGWTKFSGRVSGNTNKFRLKGHWANGKPGTIIMVRITQEELACMKKNGKFVNGTCSR
jgi:outer membrane protein OmpA-like peptidoglycan-associated protein